MCTESGDFCVGRAWNVSVWDIGRWHQKSTEGGHHNHLLLELLVDAFLY